MEWCRILILTTRMNMLNAHPPPTCMRSLLCDYCRHCGRWSLLTLPLPSFVVVGVIICVYGNAIANHCWLAHRTPDMGHILRMYLPLETLRILQCPLEMLFILIAGSAYCKIKPYVFICSVICFFFGFLVLSARHFAQHSRFSVYIVNPIQTFIVLFTHTFCVFRRCILHFFYVRFDLVGKGACLYARVWFISRYQINRETWKILRPTFTATHQIK